MMQRDYSALNNHIIEPDEMYSDNAKNQKLSKSQCRKPFYMDYKDLNFESLKERHDNFSFEKVLEQKLRNYDSIHFQGVLEHPHHPRTVLFKKV